MCDNLIAKKMNYFVNIYAYIHSLEVNAGQSGVE